MNKKLKRTLLLMTLSIMVMLTLAGCTSQGESDAEISLKWNDRTISLYTDKNCNTALHVTIEDGTDNFSLKKSLKLSGGDTLKLNLDDIAPDFCSEEAKIVDVTTSFPTELKIDWPETILLIMILLIIIIVVLQKFGH